MIVLTLSPSRAWVHKACTVYIALPSACRLMTVRSGLAIAAPVAQGGPNPIAPPGWVNNVCLAADCDKDRNGPMLVLLSSITIAFSGSRDATPADKVSGVILPVGRDGICADADSLTFEGAPSASASDSSAATTSS